MGKNDLATAHVECQNVKYLKVVASSTTEVLNIRFFGVFNCELITCVHRGTCVHKYVFIFRCFVLWAICIVIAQIQVRVVFYYVSQDDLSTAT